MVIQADRSAFFKKKEKENIKLKTSLNWKANVK
jgi:hypothetical protein